ncbi:STAS domain-containing protein [Pseudonocardia sp. N23]|uniref:STAS domain-containing protein n=1 Tax=Pseudonocardia sp. N23 TaxID=1987376 RepID=UPI000BFC0042|nr:STAS domain-containing protein [Pseudonocardia sp. N23]GAY07432.1 anti-sigma factor antagonist [Pseudonocardia sp. N23]
MSSHPEPLHLDVGTEADGRPRVTVRGELSYITAPAVDEQLRALPGPGPGHGGADVVIDLAEVSFCDSSGLAALLSAHRRTSRRGGTVVLRSPQGPMRRILRLTGVEVLFEIEETHAADLDAAAGSQA